LRAPRHSSPLLRHASARQVESRAATGVAIAIACIPNIHEVSVLSVPASRPSAAEDGADPLDGAAHSPPCG